MTTIIDYKNPVLVRKAGIEALEKELSPIGMAFFLRLFETGEGDYTSERKTYLDNYSTTDIMNELK